MLTCNYEPDVNLLSRLAEHFKTSLFIINVGIYYVSLFCMIFIIKSKPSIVFPDPLFEEVHLFRSIDSDYS